jgi:hypothetical protein
VTGDHCRADRVDGESLVQACALNCAQRLLGAEAGSMQAAGGDDDEIGRANRLRRCCDGGFVCQIEGKCGHLRAIGAVLWAAGASVDARAPWVALKRRDQRLTDAAGRPEDCGAITIG